jgi:hypothetical protein
VKAASWLFTPATPANNTSVKAGASNQRGRRISRPRSVTYE